MPWAVASPRIMLEPCGSAPPSVAPVLMGSLGRSLLTWGGATNVAVRGIDVDSQNRIWTANNPDDYGDPGGVSVYAGISWTRHNPDPSNIEQYFLFLAVDGVAWRALMVRIGPAIRPPIQGFPSPTSTPLQPAWERSTSEPPARDAPASTVWMGRSNGPEWRPLPLQRQRLDASLP